MAQYNLVILSLVLVFSTVVFATSQYAFLLYKPSCHAFKELCKFNGTPCCNTTGNYTCMRPANLIKPIGDGYDGKCLLTPQDILFQPNCHGRGEACRDVNCCGPNGTKDTTGQIQCITFEQTNFTYGTCQNITDVLLKIHILKTVLSK